jgi:hypothetical protein
MDHRIKAGQGVDGPPMQLFGTSLPLDAAKTVLSVTRPNDPRLKIYAATLTRVATRWQPKNDDGILVVEPLIVSVKTFIQLPEPCSYT